MIATIMTIMTQTPPGGMCLGTSVVRLPSVSARQCIIGEATRESGERGNNWLEPATWSYSTVPCSRHREQTAGQTRRRHDNILPRPNPGPPSIHHLRHRHHSFSPCGALNGDGPATATPGKRSPLLLYSLLRLVHLYLALVEIGK